jgi:phosphatidylserine decarboxylase
MRFAREVLPFVLPVVALALAALGFGWQRTAIALAVVAVAVLLFFRIPSRHSDAVPGAVLAPANGVVTKIDEVRHDDLGEEPYHRVVTFLSVFNVHVQRSPVAGTVVESTYTPGRKVAAFRADAGEVNENWWTVIADDERRRFGVRQIAGLLARRVVSYTEVGSSVERGELIGLIKFGSRVDLYLPSSYVLQVTPGRRLVEGETMIARPEATGDAGIGAKRGPEEG